MQHGRPRWQLVLAAGGLLVAAGAAALGPVSGVRGEQAGGSFTTIGGGEGNIASGDAATVSGGRRNRASGSLGTIGGGQENQATLGATTVGGGRENAASGPGGTVAGGYDNTAGGSASTVGGGQGNLAAEQGTSVSGGVGNRASADFAAVAGGTNNTAGGPQAMVGGGLSNTASGVQATLGGGTANLAAGRAAAVAGGASNRADGLAAAIGGGQGNAAAGQGATVPGGTGNTAAGDWSLTAGRRAHSAAADGTAHAGAFVWGDSQDADLYSAQDDQFVVRARGGLWLGSGSGPTDCDPATRFLCTSSGAALTAGGAWTNASDRALKTDFAPRDGAAVLDRLATLPLETWRYAREPAQVRHLGPTAQDFHAAFGLGDDDRSIATVDAQGVALLAAQALAARVREQDRLLGEQSDTLATLTARLDAQEAELARLRAALPAPGD